MQQQLRCPLTNDTENIQTHTQHATWRRNEAPTALDSDEPQNLQKMKTDMGHLTKFHPWEVLRAATYMKREGRREVSELGGGGKWLSDVCSFCLGWYNFGKVHWQGLHNPVDVLMLLNHSFKRGEIINFMLHVTCCNKILKQDKTKIQTDEHNKAASRSMNQGLCRCSLVTTTFLQPFQVRGCSL